tara:strand:- start:224 stop:952 length:729 start_codon:yes stop_codon:yes gene_type:complete
MVHLRLRPRCDVATVRGCDALATSANVALVGNQNPNFWRFAGRRNADGAVRAAGGAALHAACASLPVVEGRYTRCRTGGAVATSGAFGSLHAGLVVHAVPPNGAFGYGQQRWFGSRGTDVWNGVDDSPDVPSRAQPGGAAKEQLRSTFAAVLAAAEAHGARSVCMPAFGCGVMAWNAGRAAQVAVRTIRAHEAGGGLERVDLALFDDAVFRAFVDAAEEELGRPGVEEGDGVVTYELRCGST